MPPTPSERDEGLLTELIGVRPEMNDSKMTGRIAREFDGTTRWSAEAVAGLVGQTPQVTDEAGVARRGSVLRAWIEDGWVMAEIRTAE